MAHVILCSNNCIFLNHILPFVLILFCLFCKPICLPPLRSPCNFIRSYPFAILFEAFPLTTDNFDRTVRRHGKDSVSAFLSFGQKVVIQLSCNTLLSHLRYRQIIHSQFSASAYPSCLTGPSQGVRDVSEKATIISLARLSRF